MVMTEDEKRMTAYHEAGHALVAIHEPASDPIHKATIIPRGRALGMVMRLPERDSYSLSPRQDVREPRGRDGRPRRRGTDLRLRQGLVGRVAATSSRRPSSPAPWSRSWGMSDKLGPLEYAEQQDETFLGYSQTQRHRCRTRPRS